MDILSCIVKGIGMGAITMLLGYAKSVGEAFDDKKAVQTLVVGAFVGGFAGYGGLEFKEAYDYLFSIGAITLLEYAKKAVWKRLKEAGKSGSQEGKV